VDQKEAIKKINFKTQLSLFVFLIFTVLICILKVSLDLRTNPGQYHIQFYMQYLQSSTVLLFFQNLFFGSLLFFAILYSLLILKSDYLLSKGKNLFFAQIVSRGLFILIILTILYFVAGESWIPGFENKLESLKNNTLRATNLLDSANVYYENKNWLQSLKNYEEYIKIVEDDDIKVRIRELKVKVADQLLKNEKELKFAQDDTSIAEGVVSYPELAEIFYQKQDYLSSLFYYTHIKEVSKQKEVNERIDKIKEILRYKNSFMTDNEFRQYLDKSLLEIKDVYAMKKQAEFFLSEGETQKALFVFNDILKINKSLRDTVLDQNKTYQEMTKIGVDIYDAENSKIYYGKNEMVFMLAENLLIKIGFITKVLNMDTLENIFYMYNINLYKFDDNFKISSQIYAPYGQSKGDHTFTLYCYDIHDRNIEYFPFPMELNTTNYDNLLKRLSNKEKIFLNDYYKRDNDSYKIEKSLTQEEKIKIGLVIKESRVNSLSFIDHNKNKKMDYILNFPIDINIIYNFSYDYNKAINFSLYKLFSLKDFNIKNIEKSSFSIGFNNNFLKTAIVDKISRIFLFFAFGLIIITLAWKLRANYIGNFPLIYIPLVVLIIIFFYFLTNLIYLFSTIFYSMLSFSVNFSTVLIISFIINILITIASIIFIASNKT